MFVWMKGNSFTKIATLNAGNITLNTSCQQYFSENNWCIIGIDNKEKKVAIKTVSNEDIKNNKYTPDILNKVSIGKSYVRISNMRIMQEISNLLKIKLNKQKFFVYYDDKDHQLIIDLKNQIN